MVDIFLVSTIMTVPVTIVQLLSSPLNRTVGIAMALGILTCVVGFATTYFVKSTLGVTAVTPLIRTYAIVVTSHIVVAFYIRHRPEKAITWDGRETQLSVRW